VKRCWQIGIGCSLLFLATATLASAQEAPAPQEPDSQKKQAESSVEQQTTRDTLRVSYPFKFSSESAYLDWVNERATILEHAADDAPGVPRRIELLLAAANRLLASGTEHAASTRILGLVQDEMPDPKALRAIFDRADKLLESASDLIKQHDEATSKENDKEDDQKKTTDVPTPADEVEQVWRELATRRDTVQSFGQALKAYLLDAGTDDDAHNKRRAASRLSMLLESDSAAIAASARLWQALLRSKENDASRALSIVGPVTARPRVGAQPYRFYGAILRAQLLAEHRSPTLALAMLMRVEEMVETWFSGQRDRGQALRTSAFARVEILQAWAESLAKEESREEEVAWCQAGILTLQEGWLTGEMPRLLRLAPAIPLLVAKADLGVEDPKPAEKDEAGQ